MQLRTKQEGRLAFAYSGQDSELFDIEKVLAKTNDARLANESFAAWAKRIDNQPLVAISKMHYRYRFDSERFTTADRGRLKKAVEEWLSLYS